MKMQTSTVTLYERVADGVSAMIAKGTLRAGERIASVRNVSIQQRVSVSTSVRAYRLLEERGLIEARPQSGFYVKVLTPARTGKIASVPPARALKVGVNSLVEKVVLVRRDPAVVPLGAACPDAELFPRDALKHALTTVIRRNPHVLTMYGLVPGTEELRRQIARRSLTWGGAVDQSDIVITNGCTEAVTLCLRAVAKAGDVIALESPTYFGLLQVIESLGMKALEIPTDPLHGISLQALDYATSRQKVGACVVMPNVQNPLGFVMREEAKRDLVSMMARKKIPLIEDDIFGDLNFARARGRPLKGYDRDGNVMLCSSFTKVLSPGVRVGWVIPGRYARKILVLRFVSSIATSEILQLTLAEYLQGATYDRHLRALKRAFQQQIDTVKALATELFPSGTRITNPSGGYLLWLELPGNVDGLRLHRIALREGIYIAPGRLFSANRSFNNCVRINCGLTWTPAIPRALEKLGELVTQITKR